MNSQVHTYCSCCHKLLSALSTCGRDECRGSRIEQFITVPLAPQLKKKVEGQFDYTTVSKHIEAVHLRHCIIATIATSPSEAKWTVLMGLTC